MLQTMRTVKCIILLHHSLQLHRRIMLSFAHQIHTVLHQLIYNVYLYISTLHSRHPYSTTLDSLNSTRLTHSTHNYILVTHQTELTYSLPYSSILLVPTHLPCLSTLLTQPTNPFHIYPDCSPHRHTSYSI